MHEPWPKVKLGEVARHRTESIQIDDFKTYRRCRVQLHARGIVQRDKVPGAEIKTKTQWVAVPNDFLVAEIDAKFGGYGIVPENLGGAVVSSHYFLFELNQERIIPKWLDLFCRTESFHCQVAAQGSTNYSAVRPKAILSYEIPLPLMTKQAEIVEKVETAFGKLDDAQRLTATMSEDFDRLLAAMAHQDSMFDAPTKSMNEVAPLARRPVRVELEKSYPELGVRSFGKGTFHKPPLSGGDVGSKKLFWIHPGDLVFQIVFAWEGAVAIAKTEDANRCGSHRFLTCVCDSEQVLADWLLFYFLTPVGLAQLGEASPGGAGRNRTLGIDKLARMQVPVPPMEQQLKIASIMEAKRQFLEMNTFERDAEALRRSILSKAFRGEL